jgi:hypothetical protein
VFILTSGAGIPNQAFTPGSNGEDQLLKVDYKDIIELVLNMRRPFLALMRRSGSDMPTVHTETRWGIQRAIYQGFRTHGNQDEDYSDVTSNPSFEDALVRYKKTYGPQRFRKEVFMEMSGGGAMGDVPALSLQNMIDSLGLYLEREFYGGTSTTDGVIFNVTATPGVVTATQFYVDNYMGLAGQEVGSILNHLHLVGARVAFADTVGGTAHGTEDTVNGGFLITAVDATKNAERITVSAANGANLTTGTTVADGDVMYLYRASGTGAFGDGHNGLSELCFDYTRSNGGLKQGLTAATAPEWVAQVLDGNGTPRAISEEILEDACEISEAYGSGNDDVDPNYYDRAFVCHNYTRREIADLATQDRVFSEQHIDERGLSPYLGKKKLELKYNGLPVVPSQLALRNEMYLIEPSQFFIVHNGPAFGQFMEWPGHPAVQPIETGPSAQWVYMAYNNMGAKDITGCVAITELTTTQKY